MKLLSYIISFIVFSTFAKFTDAQTFGADALSTSGKKITNGFQPKINLFLGSSFHSFGCGNTFFSTHVTPELSLPVTKKFSVEVGMGYSTLFIGHGETSNGLSPGHYGTLFIKGNYKINEQLTISTTGYKTFNLQPVSQQEKLNPHALDFSNQGISINLNYKVNDNFRIDASFSYDKRQYNPFLYAPFTTGYQFGSPSYNYFGF